jgi:hypothetical protein
MDDVDLMIEAKEKGKIHHEVNDKGRLTLYFRASCPPAIQDV